MKLTRGADYGTLGILYLARQPRGRVVLINEIAEAQGVPESYLAKIFQDMAKAGLVRSHRGARGGFSLARLPEEITLRQIIEAIEGPVALNRCLDPREGCGQSAGCSVHTALAEVQRTLIDALDTVTLQSLAAQQLPTQVP
ncbi:MAG TPA: Rrf2 family transcriptional regulator [Anaerolineae bacterium]|nr:Rrf2 family transcriptional regulator [Anaerolineae bacterium]HPL29996.1 Rrf2 family transcriptional regulator [Anaerolineae bacterium]